MQPVYRVTASISRQFVGRFSKNALLQRQRSKSGEADLFEIGEGALHLDYVKGVQGYPGFKIHHGC